MANDFVDWKPLPEAFKGFSVAKEKALLTSDKWSYLVAPEESSNNEVSASITIHDAAKQFGFFGSSWSAWPDASFGDGGFEAALLLRGQGGQTFLLHPGHITLDIGQSLHPQRRAAADHRGEHRQKEQSGFGVAGIGQEARAKGLPQLGRCCRTGVIGGLGAPTRLAAQQTHTQVQQIQGTQHFGQPHHPGCRRNSGRPVA